VLHDELDHVKERLSNEERRRGEASAQVEETLSIRSSA